MSSLCPSCYLNGGREAHPAGPSTSGVLIYRLEKSGDVNYLQPIVSCMHSQLARKADCFFTFNCVGILSGFFFFFKSRHGGGRGRKSWGKPLRGHDCHEPLGGSPELLFMPAMFLSLHLYG